MPKENVKTEKVGLKNVERLNWVGIWEPIEFDADPDDREKIREIKKDIRVYIRGWLAEYNAENATNFIVEEFQFDRTSGSPLKYEVKAFLTPPARRANEDHHGDDHTDGNRSPVGGSHLIPAEPPPPRT